MVRAEAEEKAADLGAARAAAAAHEAAAAAAAEAAAGKHARLKEERDAQARAEPRARCWP